MNKQAQEVHQLRTRRPAVEMQASIARGKGEITIGVEITEGDQFLKE